LAVGPNGDLYIADRASNEILERHPDGTFTVVAGDGRSGFSGDGGPAVDAKLDLSYGGGLAFAPDGTLYIADSGNWRVRAVSPAGIITTVAGNRVVSVGQQCNTCWVTDGTSALDATLNVSDVAVGPGGHLYVATDQQILRLDSDGTFTRVVGNPNNDGGLYGIGGLAVDASADSPDGMAFDAAGDLFFTGLATKTLHMVTPGGMMTLPNGPEHFYARAAGGLATAPDGTVIGMDTLAIDRLSPHGTSTIFSFASSCPFPDNGNFLGIQCFSPNGIAVGPDGTIYADTDYGNGYTNKTAIVAISPNGKSSRLLWEPSPL
jgi:glucose/arabinose dehydrogenase